MERTNFFLQRFLHGRGWKTAITVLSLAFGIQVAAHAVDNISLMLFSGYSVSIWHYWSGSFGEALLELVLYSGLSGLVLQFWYRQKQAWRGRYRQKLRRLRQRERARTVRQTATALVPRIGRENNQLKHWMFLQKQRGRTVSPHLEEASERISHILRQFSEGAFSSPGRFAHPENTVGGTGIPEGEGSQSPPRATLIGPDRTLGEYYAAIRNRNPA